MKLICLYLALIILLASEQDDDFVIIDYTKIPHLEDPNIDIWSLPEKEASMRHFWKAIRYFYGKNKCKF